MIPVFVAAKSAISRAGLQALVRADPRFELVGVGDRKTNVPELLRKYQPAVVLIENLDTGFDPWLQSMLRQPDSPGVVLLGDIDGRATLRRALQSGVRAVLPRDSNPAEIAAAIEAVAAGLAVVTEEHLDLLLPAPTAIGDDEGTVGEPLTTRESEVLAMLSEGAGNKEIGARLHISEHTVKFHVSSILAKLGAATRTEAVSRGLREGLIVI